MPGVTGAADRSSNLDDVVETTLGEAWRPVFDRRQPPPGSGLHQCPICHGDSVVPVAAEALDDDWWDLLLRCGQCGTYREVTVSDDVVARYELDLQRGMEEIAAALERHDHERMTAEAEVFIAALQRDIIDAGDFASG